MLRVLTLSTLYPHAGAPAFGGFVARQTRGLADRDGVEVRVVAPIGIPPGLSRHPRYRALAAAPLHERWNGIETWRPRFATLPLVGAALSPALMARALLPLLRRIRADFAFDVIDAEFFYPDGPAAMRLARALGVPFSIKARGADIHHWGAQPGCARQILAAGRAAGGMLAVSAALCADMVALGLPGDRIAVHYTGVDLARFAPAPDRAAAKAALGLQGPVVLSVGHLIPRKGQALLTEAIAGVDGATLLLVGEGPDRAMLEAAIAQHRLGARVRLLGNQGHDALAQLYAAADVMALPSASEGLANAWVEALASGTPVVTCDVGGARELIDRPAAGRLVARTPQAIGAAIADLIAAPPDPHETRRAAERFTWEANAAALHAHLARIVAAHRVSR